MKLIKASYQILEPQETIFKDIELAARTCYKSEDKMTEDSANKMVEMLAKNKHTAMLEHGTVYLQKTLHKKYSDKNAPLYHEEFFKKYKNNKYSKINSSNYGWTINVTTNYRVLVENNWLNDLFYQCEPTEYHEKRVSVKFICDRGVSHEFVRHRVFSFAQESTRYCNYSKDKFDCELTFIIPCWMDKLTEGIRSDDLDGIYDSYGTNLFDYDSYVVALAECSNQYFRLLDLGWTPQQARLVLPNSLKTELVMTGFVSDWKGFFILRDAVAAHPQARELAEPLHKEFKDRGYL